MSTRTVPRRQRSKKPKTHSVLCRLCDLSQSDCAYEQGLGETVPHPFERRTVEEQKIFDLLPESAKQAFLTTTLRTYIQRDLGTIAPVSDEDARDLCQLCDGTSRLDDMLARAIG